MALTGMMLKSCSVTTGIALTTSADVRHHSADSAVDSAMALTVVALVMVLLVVASAVPQMAIDHRINIDTQINTLETSI